VQPLRRDRHVDHVDAGHHLEQLAGYMGLALSPVETPDSNPAGAHAKRRLRPSELPTPMLGHPAVGGAVARHVADARERKVISEYQDPVGCRLIK
jgi:hypothetical protein